MWWGCVLFLCAQSQTRRSPGCTSRHNGTASGTDATVQRNTNDICCTWKRGNNTPTWNPAPRLPPAIVSPAGGVREWELRGRRGGGVGGYRDRLFFFLVLLLPRAQTSARIKKKPAFCFRSEAPAALLGEFDGQLSVCRSIM